MGISKLFKKIISMSGEAVSPSHHGVLTDITVGTDDLTENQIEFLKDSVSKGIIPEITWISTTATINGTSQNISGGSVTATAPVTTLVVGGSNLSDVTFTAKVDGAGDAINPTSHDANGATFTGLNVEAGHSLVVYHGGITWFTITAQAAGGGGLDD